MGSHVLPLLAVVLLVSIGAEVINKDEDAQIVLQNDNICYTFQATQRRSIELSAAHQLISEARLESEVKPLSYILDLNPNMDKSSFTGVVRINLTSTAVVNSISLHSHFDMVIIASEIRLKEVQT